LKFVLFILSSKINVKSLLGNFKSIQFKIILIDYSEKKSKKQEPNSLM